MSRSISADFIKAFSICGVVFIHCSNMLYSSAFFDEYVRVFLRFCVPCFIFLWAYFFEMSYSKKNKIERRKYIWERFTHLFVVYLLWTLLYIFILDYKWQSLTFKKIITMYFAGYGFTGQYFFIILFQLLLLYPFLRYLYSQKILRNILLFIVFVIYIIVGYFESFLPEIILKLDNRPFLYWIPYVFAGLFLSKNQMFKIPIIFSFTVFLIPIEYFLLKKMNILHSPYITPVVLIGSLLSSSSILHNKIDIKNKFVLNTISYLGKNTLTIFVANPLIIVLFKYFIMKNMFDTSSVINKFFVPFISSFMVLSNCILIAIIIKKIRLNGILN